MIHARSPIYYVRYKKYANMDRLRKFQEALLFRIQYQTRRNMITALETIRRLRTEKNLTVRIILFLITTDICCKIVLAGPVEF